MTETHIQEMIKQAAETTHAKLHAISLTELLQREIPPREMLLAPIIPSQGLVMLYGQRGTGKTYVALSIALAAASGKSMFDKRWSTEKPRTVLYVDGEMPAVTMQERIAQLVHDYADAPDLGERLRLITPDLQEDFIRDLATPEGRAAIEDHLEGVELLILDNLSALLRAGRENEAESWLPLQSWLLQLRKRGISVLMVHHANKNGGQRGTSKKEDLLDTVIALKRPADYDSKRGAHFTVHYEKARGFHGDDAEEFEAWLTSHERCLSWNTKDLESSRETKVLALKAEGLKQNEIAEIIGCSTATVSRIVNKAPDLVSSFHPYGVKQ